MNALRTSAVLAAVAVALVAAVPLAAEAPPAPGMPDGWAVVSDRSFGAADIAPIAERLGGEIEALRNTVYDVGGQRVQLNLIVAADDASAGAIVESLHAMKAPEFVLRRELTVFELVGPDAAIPVLRAGREHLERTHPEESPE